jgi:hypothetical protein
VIAHLKAKLLRRYAYKEVFGQHTDKWTQAQSVVMRDLADYCNAYRTTSLRPSEGPIDPIASAIAEGRRQVYLRIVAMSQLPDSAILQAIERENQND